MGAGGLTEAGGLTGDIPVQGLLRPALPLHMGQHQEAVWTTKHLPWKM